jgi:hypothetical protein
MIRPIVIGLPSRRENAMRKLCTLIAGLVTVAAFAAVAQAHQVEFVSPHPVPHKFGGGFCYIDVPHVHNYLPEDPRMYREDHGQFYFVGDPAPFGYEGQRYAYYGAHPVVDAELHFGHPVFCYIKGPHFHWYQPPPQAQFQLSGGAYWYVGPFPRVYYAERPRYAVVNEAYAPIVYTRPVVDVAVAPPRVRAEISLGGPGFAAHAVVGGPPVPVPMAPAPVAPVPVAPVQIGVGIHVGGPPAVIYDERHHHDHGRHEGGRKGPHADGRRGPPARFIAGPAPVRAPLLDHRRGHAPVPHAASAPHPVGRAPAARGPAPMGRLQPLRAPARSDKRQRRRH